MDALHLVVLCSFAFAQPVFDLLGSNPTFFVAHATGPGRILLWTFLVLAVPPLGLIALEALVGLVSESARRIVHLVLVALLVAIIIVPPVTRAFGFGPVGASLALVVLATGAGFAYRRWAAARSIVTWAAPAPVAFAALFLFASPASDLVFTSGARAYAAAVDQPAPVVMVVLDELSLPSLMAADGTIDAERYPNFARLAASSTWYPNATTVAGFTAAAVPAIVDGQFPDPNEAPLPTSTGHPETLFTLLAGTYELVAHEPLTALCPTNLCEETSTRPAHDDLGSLVSDTGIVLLHTALPESTADDHLPSLDGRWAGFDDDGPSGTDAAPSSDPHNDAFWSDDRLAANDPRNDEFWAEVGDLESLGDAQRREAAGVPGAWATFLSGLEPSARPLLTFAHVNLPHAPYIYLPDGTSYDGGDPAGLSGYGGGAWYDSDVFTDAALQRYQLQLQFVDGLIGRMLDRLEDTGLLDETMLVVTADHGVSFDPGGFRRLLDPYRGNEAEIMSVPLFIRYPGQTEGTVDTRNAQSIDVFPTVADALGVQIPWKVDGTSLLGDPAPEKMFSNNTQETVVTYPPELEGIQAVADALAAPFGTAERPGDAFAMGDHRGLVRQPLDALDLGSPREDASVDLDHPDAYEAIDANAPVLPAWLTASVDGLDPRDDVAVALNGVIAGVGRVYDEGDGTRIQVMLTPEAFVDGTNEVEVFVVEDDGTLRSIG